MTVQTRFGQSEHVRTRFCLQIRTTRTRLTKPGPDPVLIRMRPNVRISNSDEKKCPYPVFSGSDKFGYSGRAVFCQLYWSPSPLLLLMCCWWTLCGWERMCNSVLHSVANLLQLFLIGCFICSGRLGYCTTWFWVPQQLYIMMHDWICVLCRVIHSCIKLLILLFMVSLFGAGCLDFGGCCVWTTMCQFWLALKH